MKLGNYLPDKTSRLEIIKGYRRKNDLLIVKIYECAGYSHVKLECHTHINKRMFRF